MLALVQSLSFAWRDRDGEHELCLAPVQGTGGKPYPFGPPHDGRAVEIRDLHVATTPVTQALWRRVMGSNPAVRPEPRCPVENVTWHDVTGAGGFLERLNASEIHERLAGPGRALEFRLPSETEWEYAARGGPRWTDGFAFSGSDDPDEVAWFGRRWTRAHRLGARLLGPRRGWRLLSRLTKARRTRTHEVGTKAPNQLGLHDLSGNVWEWCQDTLIEDLDAVPRDGTPYQGAGPDRCLRGGCHHNWDLHCTVWWRYGIEAQAHDGCIGFRVVLAEAGR